MNAVCKTKIIFLFLVKILSKKYIAVGEKLEEKWNMLRLLSSSEGREMPINFEL